MAAHNCSVLGGSGGTGFTVRRMCARGVEEEGKERGRRGEGEEEGKEREGERKVVGEYHSSAKSALAEVCSRSLR